MVKADEDDIAWVDVKLFHSYTGADLPVFMCSHDYCHSSPLTTHGAAIA